MQRYGAVYLSRYKLCLPFGLAFDRLTVPKILCCRSPEFSETRNASALQPFCRRKVVLDKSRAVAAEASMN